VLAIVKTITDLERIGDEAEKMARMAKMIHTSDRLNIPRLNELKYIGDTALEMLRNSLDAFARLDVRAAAEVLRQDLQVDASWQSIIRQLITFMMEDPRTISTSIEILFAAKAAERIGDHAKNMAENVIYLVKGTDVRHASDEELQRAMES
jgi:phosphate transport system protein